MQFFIRHKFYGLGKLLAYDNRTVTIEFLEKQALVERQLSRSEFADALERRIVRREVLPEGSPCIVGAEFGVISHLEKTGDDRTEHEYVLEMESGERCVYPESGIRLEHDTSLTVGYVDERPLDVGHLVTTSDVHGIGKIVGETQHGWQVELFHSMDNIEVAEYRTEEIKQAYLYPATRVFSRTDDGGWQLGEVRYGYEDVNGLRYGVKTACAPMQRMDEYDLFVRTLSGRSDPVALLGSSGGESQWFHDAREGFIKDVVDQRRLCQGIPAILSSKVEIVPHQISAARKILSDPIQRYLLADEVGLGKTIEAGLVIRQTLIDNPFSKIAVLCPDHLVGQWEEELNSKFQVDQFVDPPQILSFDEMFELYGEAFDMLVIDEAHRLFSAKTNYSEISNISKGIRSLLLLSATPVMGNEQVFLGMLKVLDPSVYDNVGIEEFQQKVANRKDIGNILRTLLPDSIDMVLRMGCEALKSELVDDAYAIKLADEVLGSIVSNDDEGKRRSLSALREHVAQTYRIYHRIIRNRRKEAAAWAFQPRASDGEERSSNINILEYGGETAIEIADQLELLRLGLLSFCDEKGSTQVETFITSAFAKLFTAFGIGLKRFEIELDTFNTKCCDIGLPEDVFKIISYMKSELSEAFLSDIDQCIDVVDEMIEVMRAQIGDNFEVVVFTSSPNLADQLNSNYEGDGDFEIHFFGPSGEEGANLQKANGIIHLDLPLSPVRIEQRIGRLDRFGRTQSGIVHGIVLPRVVGANPWKSWLGVLQDGYEVFDQPISDVQYLLEGEYETLRKKIFRRGESGLNEYASELPERLKEERAKLEAQYVLDQEEEKGVVAAEDWAEEIENCEEDIHRQRFNDWACARLKLKHTKDGYVWTRRTTIPQMPWLPIMAEGLKRPITFYRSDTSQADLVRIGSSLVDSLERFSRWDSRGVSFSTWRYRNSPGSHELAEVYYKLSYIIEADLRSVESDLASVEWAVARRLADSIFPPSYQVCWFDSQMEIVTDENTLDLLKLQYNSNGVTDYNLAKRKHVFDDILGDIQTATGSVSKRALEHMREQLGHSQTLRTAQRHLVDMIDSRERRRELLLGNGTQDEVSLEEQRSFDKVLQNSIMNPDIRLDAIGIMVLANYPVREAHAFTRS